MIDDRKMRQRAAGYISRFLSDRRGPDEVADIIIRMVREHDAIAAATGTAKTPQAVECEASQSGRTKIPHRPHAVGCVCKACTPEAAA
jgi:hypothetical protein